MQLSSALRTVLTLDAASCLLMAVPLVGAAVTLEAPSGIPASVLTEAGIVLALVGLFILWVANRRGATGALVRAIVWGNLGWVVASVAALTMIPGITAGGVAALVGQAVAVLAFAALEWRGLRESEWVSAP